MTPEQLDAIKERCVQATPGPWRSRNTTYQSHVDVCVRDPLYLAPTTRWISVLGPSLEHVEAVANAEFMARAREDVPTLVAEIERLQAELADSRQRFEAAAERISAQSELLTRRA